MTKVKEAENQLTAIIDQLKQLQAKGNFSGDDVARIQDRLHVIDEQWDDGAVREDDGVISEGQALVSDLISNAHDLIADLLDSIEVE